MKLADWSVLLSEFSSNSIILLFLNVILIFWAGIVYVLMLGVPIVKLKLIIFLLSFLFLMLIMIIVTKGMFNLKRNWSILFSNHCIINFSDSADIESKYIV